MSEENKAQENQEKKIEIQDENRNYFRIAVFGSSRVEEGPIYEEVRFLTKELAKMDVDIVTGGGPGLMRAANEGHREGKIESGMEVRSIGVGIRLPWNQKFNSAVEYKREFDRFSKRLDEFMLLSNAVIVTPGGIGTMLELFYTWQLVQVHHICNIPIILMGQQWIGLLDWIKNYPLKTDYLNKKDYKLLFYVETKEEALEIVKEALKNWTEGGEDFCFNYEKYQIQL